MHPPKLNESIADAATLRRCLVMIVFR